MRGRERETKEDRGEAHKQPAGSSGSLIVKSLNCYVARPYEKSTRVTTLLRLTSTLTPTLLQLQVSPAAERQRERERERGTKNKSETKIEQNADSLRESFIFEPIMTVLQKELGSCDS